MKGTLLIGPITFKKDNGKTVVISAGAEHPDMNGDELAVLEEVFMDAWKTVLQKIRDSKK